MMCCIIRNKVKHFKRDRLSMKPINSDETNGSHNNGKDHQFKSNIAIEKMADITDLAASECFLKKSMLENERNLSNEQETVLVIKRLDQPD